MTIKKLRLLRKSRFVNKYIPKGYNSFEAVFAASRNIFT